MGLSTKEFTPLALAAIAGAAAANFGQLKAQGGIGWASDLAGLNALVAMILAWVAQRQLLGGRAK